MKSTQTPDPTISMSFIAGLLILMSIFTLFPFTTESTGYQNNDSSISTSVSSNKSIN